MLGVCVAREVCVAVAVCTAAEVLVAAVDDGLVVVVAPNSEGVEPDCSDAGVYELLVAAEAAMLVDTIAVAFNCTVAEAGKEDVDTAGGTGCRVLTTDGREDWVTEAELETVESFAADTAFMGAVLNEE